MLKSKKRRSSPASAPSWKVRAFFTISIYFWAKGFYHTAKELDGSSSVVRLKDSSANLPKGIMVPTTSAPIFPTTTLEKRSSRLPPPKTDLPKIAYLISAHLTPPEKGAFDPTGLMRWHTCIFPAIRRMIPEPEPVYVVLLRNWTEKFEELCLTDPNFKRLAHRIKPVYVDCLKDDKSPLSLCCKEEKGILNFYDEFMFDEETGQAKYDWVGYQDDDTYIRHDALQIFLSTVSPTDHGVVASTDTSPGHRLGIPGYDMGASPYQCRRKDSDFMYPWGQPLFYNFAALNTISHGFRLGGLVKQCLEFGIMDDVGNALMHWMYQFPRLWVRGTINQYTKIFAVRKDFISYHGVGRFPFNYTMGRIHRHMTKRPYYVNPNNTEDLKALKDSQKFDQPMGYSNTSHYRQYGMPQSWTDAWHTMPTIACQGL